MAYYVNENIKNTYRVFPQQGRYGKKRYDMNENPEGLPKDFVDSVLGEITPEFLSIYPEPNRFLNKYASFVGNGVKLENLMATNGSDMAIRYILETFGEKGKDIVTVSPSFEMYWVNCSILGYNHVPVPYKEDMTIDIDDIVNAITTNTRIVVLLNPNNPMGNIYSEDELKKVVAKAKEVGAIVLIDEAYHYFYDKTFIAYAVKEDNVILTRTFSKLMSLAACRLGVIISNPQIIQYLHNARMTFETNSIALLFAERLIERPEIIEKLIESEKVGKEFLIKELEKNGYWCKDCMGNFVLIKTKNEPHEVTKRLEENHDVLVHAYGKGALEECIRVSVGSKEAMSVFIEALLSVEESF